jgi:hypothetical protein
MQAQERRRLRQMQRDIATATGDWLPTQSDIDAMRQDLKKEDYDSIIAEVIKPVITLRTLLTSMVTTAVRSISNAHIANKAEQRNIRLHISEY